MDWNSYEIKMKTIAQLEKEDTPNIHLMIDTGEDRLRSAFLNSFIELKRAVFPEEILLKDRDTTIDVPATIKSLLAKGLIVLQDDGSVSGLYPFSAVPTRHKVQLKDGRFFYAMCAIDSLGIAYELAQDAVVSSSCSKCNADISVEISDGEISSFRPATARAIHVALGEYKDWAKTC